MVCVIVDFWILCVALSAVTESALHHIKVPYEPKCHRSFGGDIVLIISAKCRAFFFKKKHVLNFFEHGT